jgi:hypothetical protein
MVSSAAPQLSLFGIDRWGRGDVQDNSLGHMNVNNYRAIMKIPPDRRQELVLSFYLWGWSGAESTI